ncbi:MAG: hypothetical protein J0I12_35410 [Candidatus Eremiobacteraeota bacterium]|nr:hypothetical protein [Candidatus Eremiobacteraeota bacterium]
MRKTIVAAIVGAVCCAAYADVAVEDVLARREGADINVRVTVNNPAKTSQKGPVKITLSVRQTEADKWQVIKTWTDISKLAAGNRVSRDFFQANHPLLRQLAEQGAFEIRAVAEAPGAPKTGEKVVSWKDTMKGK